MVPSPAGFHSKTYRLAAVEVIHRIPYFGIWGLIAKELKKRYPHKPTTPNNQ
jgi:hypothetical protein